MMATIGEFLRSLAKDLDKNYLPIRGTAQMLNSKTLITETAVSSMAKCCPKVFREPNRILKKYKVGKQMMSVIK